MDERTITITQAEYNKLHEIYVKYNILRELNRDNAYMPKEDKVLYNLTADIERGVDDVDE